MSFETPTEDDAVVMGISTHALVFFPHDLATARAATVSTSALGNASAEGKRMSVSLSLPRARSRSSTRSAETV